MSIPFDEIGRLPASGDNVAIASRRLPAGTIVDYRGAKFSVSHTILEGHRFAVSDIPAGSFLLSWGLPFGIALRQISPGEYVCNAKILRALRERHVDFTLPEQPNFENYLASYTLDEQRFTPGDQVPRHARPRFFEGYARPGRGVGTRNCIVVLGASSWTGSLARTLAERFRGVSSEFTNIDGVVAVAHTEGGGVGRPNNFELVVRTLAGFMVNPNVAAVLAIDAGNEPVNNRVLEQYLLENRYPIGEVPHRYLSVQGNFKAALAEGERIIRDWLPVVNANRRTSQSVEHLRIALQCGGSDAFSGVSGNPLAGWVSKEVIRYGGAANLAETDELIGAEPYVLSNVRDLETARRFLRTLARFQERASWHGHDAEGNPSGGNNFRGLYNIAIKSIGAARKKDPDVRLDYVIDYGERMEAPGFYFMDSPGNDLESIAGQVASGCNLILFTTGNGSVTNFPFVPTIKIMTNTGRFKMLTHEMDVNAGRYQDGVPMDVLGAETFDLTVRIASGERSVGEKAGHSQVQIWREWRQTDRSQLDRIRSAATPTGEPISLTVRAPVPDVRYRAIRSERGVASDQVGLIVPTSLCSGQIARLIAERLNRGGRHFGGGTDNDNQAEPIAPVSDGSLGDGEHRRSKLRFVALPHTEGCGNSAGDSEEMFLRTMAGYLTHPFVCSALLLEHGCEKTHNDAMRNFLAGSGVDTSRFGWASVQLDGGMEKVATKVSEWFASRSSVGEPAGLVEAGLDSVRLAVTSVGQIPVKAAIGFAALIAQVVNGGGTVVVPENASLLKEEPFLGALSLRAELAPTLSYGQRVGKAGFHIMQTPTDHQVETFTGLGATGVELILANATDRILQGHPMVPLAQVASWPSTETKRLEVDLVVEESDQSAADLAKAMLDLVVRILSREYTPKAFVLGNTDFQMTRGWLGISL